MTSTRGEKEIPFQHLAAEQFIIRLGNAAGEFSILDLEGFPLQRQGYAVSLVDKQLSIVARTLFGFQINEEEPFSNLDASGMPRLLSARQ